VAAVAAVEFLGTKRDGADGPALEDVGKPSEVLLQALEHADDGPGSEPGASAASVSDEQPDAADADGGRSIWRDLPPAEGSV
jgi:hypothetical protein